MPLSIFMNFIVPVLIAGIFWNDALGGLLIAGFLRLVFTHHSTFLINSLCHFFGSQPYSDRHTARDNAITALFTWGEGYHNFHHEFANDYRNGVRWFQFDPGKWAISLMSHMRLAWGLKRAPDAMIKQRRMQMQKGETLTKLEKWGWAEERKQVFLAKLDETLVIFKRRVAIMNQIRNKLRDDAVRVTAARLELMQLRYNRVKEAVAATAMEWKLLRRTARA
jgi:stearoyl-CoA desaturase (delta-9 desaturase)